MTRALVVVPAHDEGAVVGAALAAVRAALDVACTGGILIGADIVVAAHRCSDDTAARALAALAGLTTGTGIVVEDATSQTVGEVRDGAVRAALARLPLDPDTTWLLSTDADSTVPLDWVGALLGAARADDALAVAGMVRLVDWQATPAARAAYDAVIRAGLRDEHHHDHVYAANLAVRLDAYLAAGGFPFVRHGEETGLLAALRTLGLPVTSTRGCVVETSGRMPGRAAEGLGSLLSRLADDPTAVPLPAVTTP